MVPSNLLQSGMMRFFILMLMMLCSDVSLAGNEAAVLLGGGSIQEDRGDARPPLPTHNRRVTARVPESIIRRDTKWREGKALFPLGAMALSIASTIFTDHSPWFFAGTLGGAGLSFVAPRVAHGVIKPGDDPEPYHLAQRWGEGVSFFASVLSLGGVIAANVHTHPYLGWDITMGVLLLPGIVPTPWLQNAYDRLCCRLPSSPRT